MNFFDFPKWAEAKLGDKQVSTHTPPTQEQVKAMDDTMSADIRSAVHQAANDVGLDVMCEVLAPKRPGRPKGSKNKAVK